MHITLVPQRRDDSLSVVKSGETLTLNNAAFDFSHIHDGETLPPEAVDSEFICGLVERIDGVLHLSLLLPHGPNPPTHVAFPLPLIDPPDGPLNLPAAEPEPEDPSND